jgi:hypothetical protein
VSISLKFNENSEPKLNESMLYQRLRKWNDSDLLRENIVRMKKAEGAYKTELFKKCRKMDFLTTFIIICELGSQHLTYGRRRETFIKNMIGSVIGRLIFETSDIKEIRTFLDDFGSRRPIELRKWLSNRRKGEVWILDTFLEETIKEALSKKDKLIEGVPETWKMSYSDYAKYEFSIAFGTSYTDVQSVLSRGVSRTSLCNLLYDFIMIRRLMEGLENGLILTWYGDGDLFIGSSGIRHFFDGIILLGPEDESNPWLLKCVSAVHNPLDAVESIDSKLVDIGMKRCILFMPMYPSQKALRYSLHAYTERDLEICMLYLHDLYNILRMNSCDIPSYLRGKTIR